MRKLCGVVSVSRLEASPGLEAVHRHRRGYLRIPGGLPFHAGGAWCAVVPPSSISASRSVQNSRCRLLGGENGIKLSLHAEQARNWAISGEQGEFCTGHAVRRGVRGEFCTGGARCGSCWESCVVLSRSLCAGWWAYGSALALLMGTAAGLSGSSGAPHAGGAGSLMGSALEGLRLHARKSSPCVAVRS